MPEFYDGLASIIENSSDLVIDAVTFDGATAVSQKNRLRTGGAIFQIFFGDTFSKIHFCGVLKNKVVHNSHPF